MQRGTRRVTSPFESGTRHSNRTHGRVRPCDFIAAPVRASRRRYTKIPRPAKSGASAALSPVTDVAGGRRLGLRKLNDSGQAHVPSPLRKASSSPQFSVTGSVTGFESLTIHKNDRHLPYALHRPSFPGKPGCLTAHPEPLRRPCRARLRAAIPMHPMPVGRHRADGLTHSHL